MHKYRLVAKKGEGTFSEVLKAQCIKNSKYVAIKCMKNHFDSLEQVNNLREIQALRRLSPHPNIIKLLEVLYDQPTGRLALVFELMDMNIYELIRGRSHYVAEERIRRYMYQLIKAMDHMHKAGIFHRDIKPENILIIDECLKLADFGSCRGIYSKQPYTEYISTRWYRAPECLLTDGYYTHKMDMWGVGCVFFEVVSLFPLFPGTNEMDQIEKIHAITGTPSPEILATMKRRSTHVEFDFPPKEGTGITKLIPHLSPEGQDLLQKLLMYNPEDRISAKQALRHAFFREIREEEKRLGAASQPDVHSLLTPPPRNRQGGSVGGLASARRRVANQSTRDTRDSLPSIVGSNRGHQDKDGGGSESGASHTHHLPGISSVSSETEERLHAAAVSVLPSLVVGNTALNPAASKLLNHRVPMGGGGYMQAHSYTKPAAGKSSSMVSKGVRQPMPSARSSAYKYKNAPSSNASIVSSAALGGKNASKYVSPYSQQYLNVLRE